MKSRAFAEFTFDRHPPVVLLHDAINRCEAKSRALGGIFGGEKGFKNVRENIRRNARAAVGDAEANICVGPRGLE